MNLPPLLSYHWFDSKGRLKTVFDKNKIPIKTPYVIKVMEDLNKYICIHTVQIPNTDIFDVLVTDDNKNEIDNNVNVKFFISAMLRLANKKGMK